MSAAPRPHFRLALIMPCVLSVSLVVAAGDGQAQVYRAELTQPVGPTLAQATLGSPETVRLLTGLAKIESDLQLGLLFLKDGLTNPEGSHFTHPMAETYPGIKDGLAAAGAADFAAQLVALEGGGSEETVMAAYSAAVLGLMQARSTLRASPRDLLVSIVEQTRAVVAEINPEGPTDAADYQDAWAMLMVARTQIDLLSRNEDQAIVEAAKGMALTFDDIILTMPDPNTQGPVAFDPAPIVEAIGKLELLAGSA
jgi:hypothetical protein